ncbi:MAG: folate-binding protein YgfZ [Gammaproteobacteria bacterium]|nr:folate-binding protein YgfZ [Gammaproteobacteria bacterium]
MPDNLLSRLNYLGLLEVGGEEAAGFLQNLLSNDVRKVTASQSQLNSLCTPKGRMLAIFRLFKRDDRYWLRMPLELVTPIRKRLQMYVLRSKVTLQAQSNWVGIGISGPQATTLLREHFSIELQQVNSVAQHADLSVLSVPGNERYELYAPVERMQTLWPIFSHVLTPVNDDQWRLLDIQNGIPTVYTATSEHFVPQMTNLQIVKGISFKKGCYPGQEVVARMQYLGKLKRRMYLVQIQSDQPPVPGTTIVSIEGNISHEAGEIVDATLQSGQKVLALAVLPIASTGQTLHLLNQTGPRLELLPLPYPFAADYKDGA